MTIEDKVEQFAKDLEGGKFWNVEQALAQVMCCNGHMCGCRASTVGDYLAYELRQVLPTRQDNQSTQ